MSDAIVHVTAPLEIEPASNGFMLAIHSDTEAFRFFLSVNQATHAEQRLQQLLAERARKPSSVKRFARKGRGGSHD